MEAESRLSDSFRARNLKAGRVFVEFCHVSKEHARVKCFAKWTSNGPHFFPSPVYLFFSTALTRHLHQNLNQPRSFWQKGSYFTISRLVIAERHRKHTHSVPDGLRVLYRPRIQERGHVARAISIYGQSEHPRDVEFITAYSVISSRVSRGLASSL